MTGQNQVKFFDTIILAAMKHTNKLILLRHYYCKVTLIIGNVLKKSLIKLISDRGH